MCSQEKSDGLTESLSGHHTASVEHGRTVPVDTCRGGIRGPSLRLTVQFSQTTLINGVPVGVDHV